MTILHFPAPNVPTVSDICKMSESAITALVESAMGWPPSSMHALQQNLRLAALAQFQEAEALEAQHSRLWIQANAPSGPEAA